MGGVVSGIVTLAPFHIVELAPADSWVWTHLCGVRTSPGQGMLYDATMLKAEIMCNPVMQDVTLCMEPHWHQVVDKLHTIPRGTVLMPLVDHDGSVCARIAASGIHMFGKPSHFVVLGDTSRLIQCGQCHMLGHSTKSPQCKLPTGAVKCHRCGGTHQAKHHDFYCKKPHRTGGKCDCKFKCLLCGKLGHHARSRLCPLRADSAPPPPLYEPVDEIEEFDPVVPDARIDDVPTQREPLTEASLPVTARPVTTKACTPKAKGKGKAKPAKPQPKAKKLTMSDLIATQGLLTFDSGLTAWDESEVPGVGCDPTLLNYSTPPKTPFNRPACMHKVHGPDSLASTAELLERMVPTGLSATELASVNECCKHAWGVSSSRRNFYGDTACVRNLWIRVSV